MSSVTSLVERYNAQMAKCRQQLQGGLKEEELCLPLEKVKEYTAIYNHATGVIRSLLKDAKPDNSKVSRLQEELRATQTKIQTMIDSHAKDKLEFEREAELLITAQSKSGQDAFTQLNEKLEKAYAQIRKMIDSQKRDTAATEQLKDAIANLIKNQKKYCDLEIRRISGINVKQL